jgi:calcium/proton exchanger cax
MAEHRYANGKGMSAQRGNLSELGSSIQIALFVAPMLVFASYLIAPQPLELSFGRAEVGSLFIGAFIGTVVCGDGHSKAFPSLSRLPASTANPL